jgi:hypothetical protein
MLRDRAPRGNNRATTQPGYNWAGKTIEATIVLLNHYTTTDSEGDVSNHYQLQLSAADVGGFSDEVSAETFKQLRSSRSPGAGTRGAPTQALLIAQGMRPAS